MLEKNVMIRANNNNILCDIRAVVSSKWIEVPFGVARYVRVRT